MSTGEERTTVFRQTDENAWKVEEKGRTRALSGSFNGVIYVDGDIVLRGDGTDRADIAANSQFMLVTTGDIIVTASLTYTDNPLQLRGR